MNANSTESFLVYQGETFSVEKVFILALGLRDGQIVDDETFFIIYYLQLLKLARQASERSPRNSVICQGISSAIANLNISAPVKDKFKTVAQKIADYEKRTQLNLGGNGG